MEIDYLPNSLYEWSIVFAGIIIVLIELWVIIFFVSKVMDAAMFISDKVVDFCLSFIIKE
jgi:hypothetical protein